MEIPSGESQCGSQPDWTTPSSGAGRLPANHVGREITNFEKKSLYFTVETRCYMDKRHVKGATEKVEGKVKEVVGRITGNRKLENKGKLDQVKGAAHNAVADAKDAGKEAIASVKNAPSRQ